MMARYAFDPSRKQFLSAAFVIWLIFVVSYAVWIFVIPHDYLIGPEVGPLAAYFLFASVYSIPYAIGILLVGAVCNFRTENGGPTDRP
jgi:hypothetical protein